MAYVTVTTWEFAADIDEDAMNAMAEKNMSSVKEMGAERGYSVRTSDTTGIIVMIYPDKATWDRVSAKVAELRRDAQPQMNTKLTGAMEGEAGVVV